MDINQILNDSDGINDQNVDVLWNALNLGGLLDAGKNKPRLVSTHI